MRWFPFVVVAALAVLVQTTLMRLAVAGDAFPDLLVALLATFCLGVAPAEGFAAGVVLGLGRDLFTIEPFGLSTGLFAVLGWLVSRQRPAGLADHFLTRAAYAFLCSVASSVASVLVLVAEHAPPALPLIVRRTGLTALSTAALAALVGALVWHRTRWFGLRRRSEFADV